MSDSIKPIYKIKDVQLLCHTEQLRVKVVKEYLEEDSLIKKEHAVLTYSLVNIGDEEAEKKVKELIGEVCLAQAKEIGVLNDRINAMSKECAIKVDIATKESSEKMILQTRLEAHQEELKHASEVCDTQNEEINKLKIINDEIYKENQALRADKERLIKDLVVMDERVINPVKAEVIVNDANEKYLASEVERLSNKVLSQEQMVLEFDTANKAFKFSNDNLNKEISSLQKFATNLGKEVGKLKEQLKAK